MVEKMESDDEDDRNPPRPGRNIPERPPETIPPDGSERTHSLSVEASIRIRARGRPPKTSANRSWRVRMRRWRISPCSATVQI